jgi:hypothetical protein
MSESAHDEVLVKKRARALFWTGLAVVVFVTWMMVSSALQVWSAWESHKSSEAAAAARGVILSCVTPNGSCSKEQAAKTGEAIRQIYKDGIDRELVTRATIIASVWCDEQPDVVGINQLEQCVKEQLALKERDRGDQ